MRRACKAALCLVALSLPLSVRAEVGMVPEELRAKADKLIDQALQGDLAYRIVESLTTEVGPRFAGTAAEARARAWAERMLTDMNFERVRIEPFNVRLWTRGEESAEITEPYPQPLAITALAIAWAPPMTASRLKWFDLEQLPTW